MEEWNRGIPTLKQYINSTKTLLKSVKGHPIMEKALMNRLKWYESELDRLEKKPIKSLN